MSDNEYRDMGAGEGGNISIVVEEQEEEEVVVEGDDDKVKDDLNRSQSPSAMSQSSNYLEWDPSADVGALSAIPGSSSSGGGRGRGDELYLGSHFEDSSESPEVKVVYGPKKLLTSNPSISNQLYCYSTPQSSTRTSRVTFSSFDCSPIEIQSPPEFKDSSPSTEVSVKECRTRTISIAPGKSSSSGEGGKVVSDDGGSTSYKTIATAGSSSAETRERDLGIDYQSPPEYKESAGSVEGAKKTSSSATVTYSSTDYKSVAAVRSVPFTVIEDSDGKVTVSSTAYKSVPSEKTVLKKESKGKALHSSATRTLNTGRYFADESNNNNEEKEEEEDLTVEETSRRTPQGVVVSDASTDWEYDNEKTGGGYRPDWRTHGITRSEIEYAERKKSGSSSSASSAVFLLQVEASAKKQCGSGRVTGGTSSADEGGGAGGGGEERQPVPSSMTQKKSLSKASTELRSRTASATVQVSSSSASGPATDESELERRLSDIRSRCPAVSSSISRRGRNPSGSDPNSLTMSSNAGDSSTSSSSLGVDPETLLKILESHPSTESVKYDALKIHRDYHLAQVWKQIAKLAELNRALLTHKVSKEELAGDGRGSRSVQKVNRACGPSEPSSMISGFEGRGSPPKRHTSDHVDNIRRKVTNEDIVRAKQEMERNPRRAAAAEYVRKTDMGPPPPPKTRGPISKKKTVIVPPPVKVFLAPQKPMQSTSTAASGGDSESDDTGPLKKAIKNYLKKHNIELYRSIKADVSAATSSSGYSRLEQSSMKESAGLPSDGYLSDSYVYLQGRGKGATLKMARERNQEKKVEELRENLRKALEKQQRQQPQVPKGRKKPAVGFYIALGEGKEDGGQEGMKGPPKKTIQEYLREQNPQCYKNMKERDEILIQVKREREANHVQMDFFIEQAAAYQREGQGKERIAGNRGVGNGWGEGNRDDLKEFWETYMMTAQKNTDDENKENENAMRKDVGSPHVISTREMKARTARLRTNDSVAYQRRRKEMDDRRRKATRLLQKQFSENLREFRKVVGDVNVPDRLKLGPRPR